MSEFSFALLKLPSDNILVTANNTGVQTLCAEAGHRMHERNRDSLRIAEKLYTMALELDPRFRCGTNQRRVRCSRAALITSQK